MCFQNCEILHLYINDILDYSKMVYKEQIKLNISSFDLKLLLNDIMDLHNLQAKSKNLEFSVKYNFETNNITYNTNNFINNSNNNTANYINNSNSNDNNNNYLNNSNDNNINNNTNYYNDNDNQEIIIQSD